MAIQGTGAMAMIVADIPALHRSADAERAHAGQQPRGEAVGHALHAEHEARHRVLAEGVPADPEAATQLGPRLHGGPETRVRR
jgi:hypothetical protein